MPLRIRLNKCVAVGMRKESILNDEEKQYRRQLIEENRKKRLYLRNNKNKQNMNAFEENIDTELDEQNICNNNSSNDDCIGSHQIDSNEFIDELVDCNNTCDENNINENDCSDDNNGEETESIDSNTNSIESALPLVVMGSPTSNIFTDMEGIRLLELFRSSGAFQRILVPLSEITTQIDNYPQLYPILDKFFDKEIRNCITLSKNLSTFEVMCENDRLSLVKYGCVDIMCLRSAAYYHRLNEYWTIFLDQNHSFLIKLDVMKYVKIDMYYVYKTHFTRICSECDSDL
ncbi:unnamed protein product, partial [Oppiella nova]